MLRRPVGIRPVGDPQARDEARGGEGLGREGERFGERAQDLLPGFDGLADGQAFRGWKREPLLPGEGLGEAERLRNGDEDPLAAGDDLADDRRFCDEDGLGRGQREELCATRVR
jgi:hypothetical protein